MNINIILIICGIGIFIVLILCLINYLNSKNTRKYRTLDLGVKDITLSDQTIKPNVLTLNTIQLNPKQVPYNQPLPPVNFSIFGVPDQETLNKKIYTLINLFAPVYNFHSDEKFYPGTPDSCNNIVLNNKNITNSLDLLNIGNTNENITNNIKIINNHIVANCKDIDYALSFNQTANIINTYANLAGDLSNPYFEQTNTYYHNGCPGGPFLWNTTTFKEGNQEFATKVITANKNINWKPNPQICSVFHKPIVRNNNIKFDNKGNPIFVTDFIYTTYFVTKQDNTQLPSPNINTIDKTTVVVRFLTSDLEKDIYGISPPMPCRFYLSSNTGGQWFLPKDLLFRKLNQKCIIPSQNAGTPPNINSLGVPEDLGRNTVAKTHVIIYVSRDSHNLYNSANPPNKLINDSLGGGVCWQPPVVYLDRPQTIDAWNTVTTFTKDNYFSTYYSPKFPDIKTFFNKFNNGEVDNTLADFFLFFTYESMNGYAADTTVPYGPPTVVGKNTVVITIDTLTITRDNINMWGGIRFLDIKQYLLSPFFGFGMPYLYYTGNKITSLYSRDSYLFYEGACLPKFTNKEFTNSCEYEAGFPTNNLYPYMSDILPRPFMDTNIDYIKGIYSNAVCDPNNYQKNILNGEFKPVCNQTTKRFTGTIKAITNIRIIDTPPIVTESYELPKRKTFKGPTESPPITESKVNYPELSYTTSKTPDSKLSEEFENFRSSFEKFEQFKKLFGSDNLTTPKKYNISSDTFGIALAGNSCYATIGLCALFKYIFDKMMMLEFGINKTENPYINFCIAKFFRKITHVSTVGTASWFWSIFSFVLSNRTDINIEHLLGKPDDTDNFSYNDFIGARFTKYYDYMSSFQEFIFKYPMDKLWGVILGKYLLDYYKINDDIPISLNAFHDMEMRDYNINFTNTLIYDKFNVLPFWVSNATMKFDYAGIDYPNILINLSPLYSGIPITYTMGNEAKTQNTIGGILVDTFCFGLVTPPPAVIPECTSTSQATISSIPSENTICKRKDNRGFDLIEYNNLTQYDGWQMSTDCYYRWLQSNYDKYATTTRLVCLRDIIAMSSQKDTSTVNLILSLISPAVASVLPNTAGTLSTLSTLSTVGTGIVASFFTSVGMLNNLNYCNLLWGTLPPQPARKTEDCTPCGNNYCSTINGILYDTCEGDPLTYAARILIGTSDFELCKPKNSGDITIPSPNTNPRYTQLSYINNDKNDADPTGIISLISRGITRIILYVYPESDVDTNCYLYSLFKNTNETFNNKIFDDTNYDDILKLIKSGSFFSTTLTTCVNQFYKIEAGKKISLFIVYINGEYYKSLTTVNTKKVNEIYKAVYVNLNGKDTYTKLMMWMS